MFGDLEVGALTRIMRPTMLFAIVGGVLGAGVAMLLGSPFAAVGIVVGVALAILNVRLLAAGVTRVEMGSATATRDAGRSDDKVIRRLLRRGSAVRLLLVTVLVVGLAILKAPLGIGVGAGLLIFQIAFVLNAGRAILSAPIG